MTMRPARIADLTLPEFGAVVQALLDDLGVDILVEDLPPTPNGSRAVRLHRDLSGVPTPPSGARRGPR